MFRNYVALWGWTTRETLDYYEAADLAFLMAKELPGVPGARTHRSFRTQRPRGNYREAGTRLARPVQRRPGDSIRQGLGRSPLPRL